MLPTLRGRCRKALCAFFVQVFLFEMPMFRRDVDSFPPRRISGTPRHRKLAKVMPKFSVNFILSSFISLCVFRNVGGAGTFKQ